LDTGVGIPPGKLDDVFQPFHQLHPSQAKGLGLGLSIVKRTADALGHALRVTSALGQGSRFTVQVPLARD
jgi:signal transduction histidine kinase